MMLDKNLNFENFKVIGNNRFTYITLKTIAKMPDINYNPLLICGKNESDKVHLLNSFINHQESINKKVVYLKLNDIINSLKERKISTIVKNLDVAIIDNIDKIEYSSDIERGFLYLITTLVRNKKQLVICSTKEPNDLIIDMRLKKRFNKGLILYV